MTPAPPVMSAPEPRKRRSWLPMGLVVVVVVAIVVAVGAGQGWFGGSETGATGPSASVEGIIPADTGVVAEGRAVPVAWAQVVPVASGRVAAIPVAVGDSVAAGDVLVQVDDAAARLDVATATAAVDAAAAATARAQAGVDQAKAGVDQAQAAVDQAQAARRGASAALSAARASVSAAQAAVRAADAARDALPDAATKAQKRQADAQVSQASAGVSQASAQASQAAAGVDQAKAAVDVARAQRAAARDAVDSARASLDAARADEERARAGLSAAQLGLDNLAVTSPIAGTVISIEPAIGDLVGPTAVVARVADTSGWRFETSDLSETSIARVREGAGATISVDGLPGEDIAGTVESVGDYGTPMQGDIVYRVVVAPSGEVPQGLRWNMTVTIEIDGIAAGS